jgi:hypothetical protein
MQPRPGGGGLSSDVFAGRILVDSLVAAKEFIARARSYDLTELCAQMLGAGVRRDEVG